MSQGQGFDGKVVVVTGAARGLGRALALAAASRGASVMVGDVLDGEDTAALIRERGARAEFVPLDVTSFESVASFRDAALERFGGVNVVCNNAGVGASGSLADVDLEAAHHVFAVNVVGMFNVVHAFAQSLLESAAKGELAALLNTGSEHSLGVPPFVAPMSVYTTSKFAAMGLSASARRDFADKGVTVSLLTPSYILTERVRMFIEQNSEFAASVEPIAQTTEEVAELALDGMLEGRFVIPTNPVTREFALDHAARVVAEIERLPVAETSA